ncbi:Imidazolonepropionase [Granulicella rosea]|uniref:Imidazolonepropionase n=1 Tax=Granulicella rosea TaxID=474952 RepID=A0A239DPV4_9BACT|nr:amidohydrolase family protein [Granulicella rosea]SNS33634.1 Imidazolonepropionase [Granulicella rosea]
MRIVTLLAAAILCAGPGARAADLVLTHARIYASPTAKPIEDGTILIHDGKIVSAGKSIQIPKNIPADDILDCKGQTVTAGLWNSHVHLLPVQFLHADEKSAPELTKAFQEMLTRWGFTTVFDIASTLANAETLRNRINTGEVRGPNILTVGEPFFPPHGVPVYVQGYLAQQHITLPDDATTAEAAARAQKQIEAGADGVKIFAGSIQEDTVLMMPLDRAKAIVNEAHRLHRPVFAHPTNLAGVNLALDSGVDILAHVTSDSHDGPWPSALVQRMLSAHMALIPTLTLFDVEAKKGGATPEAAAKFADQAVARLRAYASAGGEILFGTDVGYIYQFDTTEEYALMQHAGMSFPQILASLTTSPARRFGLSAHTGSIAPKMDADLVVLEGDPAADITAFARVRCTIRNGTVIYRAPEKTKQ